MPHGNKANAIEKASFIEGRSGNVEVGRSRFLFRNPQSTIQNEADSIQ
jgi:hypothetical protein